MMDTSTNRFLEIHINKNMRKNRYTKFTTKPKKYRDGAKYE